MPWTIHSLRMTVAALLVLAFAMPASSAFAKPGKVKKHVGPAPHGVVVAPKSVKRNGPPAHAPAHGYRRKHQYRYYPRQKVYYSAEQKQYFWMDGGAWKFGAKLPSSVRLTERGVSVDLPTLKPFTMHKMVLNQMLK